MLPLRPASFALLVLPFAARAAEKVDYNYHVRPILSTNCFSCHGPDAKSRKADLRLDSFAGATAENDGIRAIVPGDPVASALVARVSSDDPDEIMPPPESHRLLTPAQRNTLAQWIAEGAEYQDHWAFVAPKKPAVPATSRPAWVRNPIDTFIVARQLAAGLEPSTEAGRAELLRRVTFDLTGLPPTLEELNSFLTDTSPDAYEKVVDRLLASPHFGERMALAWMDAARYGDTSVMHADGPRDMWPWRDWVIKAYNENKPFDEFTVEQLAGDLLPDATPEQKLATGFNRNHASSDEGGAIAEELRVEYVVDRVKTTSNVFLGLSMECGQCHDHKFDPITQKDYYRFFAYFNNTQDPGMQSRNGNQVPVVELMNPARAKGSADFAARREALGKELEARRTEAAPAVTVWVAAKTAEREGGTSEKTAPVGLVHHFPLDEKADEPVREVLSGVTGKLAGKYERQERDGNACIQLDGKTTVDFPNVGGFVDASQPLTLAAWVNAPANVNGAVFSHMKTGEAYRGYDLWLQDGSVGSHIISHWPDNALKVVSKPKLRPDQWEHIAIVYDGSGKTSGMKIYINGEAVEFNVEQDNLTGSILADVPFRIGARDVGANVRARVDDIRLYNRALDAAEIAAAREGRDPLDELLAVPENERTPEQSLALANLYLSREDQPYQAIQASLAALGTEEQDFLAKTGNYTSMIMTDNAQPRVTYVLNRGDYNSPIKDEEMKPGVPSALPALPDDAPSNRLGLAQWLVRPDHPLTARVAVNRYWAMLFGRGIVGTVMDFGNQGELPSHPELLDWLAVDFVENGWDTKRTLRQIVNSATYRQSSRVTPEALAADPENRLLSRGPRFRLQGEFIRDNALAVSGLLVDHIGGPGVKPYQPPGLWNEVSLDGNLRFVQDKGENLYRRSMYIYWKRSAPAPSMTIFDAPSREKCVVERDRTNTPLQALVTLNDVQFVEASRKLAERMMHAAPETDARIHHAFRLTLARDAFPEEIAICREVLENQLANYRVRPEEAKKYLSAGDSPRDESFDPAELAAWAVLANLILNLDEVLVRG
jgi:mono/diheme cytochrome c family protein